MSESFQPGAAVRVKGGDGAEMFVEGYESGGRVLCSLWAGVHRETRPFVEETLEVIPPASLRAVLRKLQRDLPQGKRSGEGKLPASP